MAERKKQKTMTEEEFASQYAPLKASKKTPGEMITFLDLSRQTFYNYKKRYEARLTNIDKHILDGELVEGSSLADKHISRALSISDDIIKDALKVGNKEKAFDYALEQVKIAKTDAEIKRVFGIFVDARVQTVNVVVDKDLLTKRIKDAEQILEGAYKEAEAH